MLGEMNEMERMHVMCFEYNGRRICMCDMRVCVRMNACFIHTGHPKNIRTCLLPRI